MINGQEYAWEDVQVVVEGKGIPVTGVKSIEYGNTRVHENIYGRGSRPVSMGRGKTEMKEGTIVLLQSELEAMQQALPPGKSLTDRAAFAITVGYAAETGPRTTDKLLGCRITDVPKKIGGDETHMTVELKFLPFQIIYGSR